MSNARYEIAPQYVRAEQTRQRYLDYLNQNPGRSAAEIAEYMTVTHDDDRYTGNATRQMIAMGEIRAVKTNGLWRYFPIATKTTSALSFSIKQRSAAKMRIDARNGNTKVEKIKLEDEPWRYVHKPSYINNSGGQGALRERVWAGSSCGMV